MNFSNVLIFQRNKTNLRYIKDMIKADYFNDKTCNESPLDSKIGKL